MQNSICRCFSMYFWPRWWLGGGARGVKLKKKPQVVAARARVTTGLQYNQYHWVWLHAIGWEVSHDQRCQIYTVCTHNLPRKITYTTRKGCSFPTIKEHYYHCGHHLLYICICRLSVCLSLSLFSICWDISVVIAVVVNVFIFVVTVWCYCYCSSFFSIRFLSTSPIP